MAQTLTRPDLLAPDVDIARRARLLDVLAGATLFLLIVISAASRWSDRSRTYFIDEIWVLDFAGKGVYVPHAVHQPPLFFYPVAAMSRLCGNAESCMRMPSEVSALLLTIVPLAAWRTTRTVGRTAAIAWTTILGFSSPISFYAARLKQYPLEALGGAVLLWLFIRAVERDRWVVFACAAVFFLLTLHTPVFVLCATGAGVFVLPLSWRRRARLLALHVVFALVFAAAYVGYMKPGPAVTRYFGDLTDYYIRTKPMFWDGSASFVAIQTRTWLGQMLNLTRFLVPLFVLLIGSLAVSLVVKRDRRRLAIMIASLTPPLLVLCASALHRYPYGEIRLLVFVFPGLSLAFALAVQWLCSKRRFSSLAAGAVFAVLLAIFAIRDITLEPYNATYMRVWDQRHVYELLKARKSATAWLACKASDSVALSYYVGIPMERIVRVSGTDRVRFPTAAHEVWTFAERGTPLNIDASGFRTDDAYTDGRIILARYERIAR